MISNGTELLLPVGWEQSIIARHLDAPYSREALAEPAKEVLDIGAVDFANIPRDDDRHLFGDPVIKWPDRTALSHSRSESEYLIAAHKLFLGAAAEIMGADDFAQSMVRHVSHCSEVDTDATQRYAASMHLDGYRFREMDRRIRLIGMAFDVLPCRAYQGPFTPEDMYDEEERGGIEAGDLRLTPNTAALVEMPALECGRLFLTPPSLPHASRVATETIDRHFMRWTVWL